MDAYLERIKKLKSQKKMTNSMLSERTGIPLGTLSKVLAGMSDALKLPFVVSLAEALDTSVEYIATGVVRDENTYVLDEREQALISGYRKLDVFGRSMVETVLNKEVERLGDLSGESVPLMETAEEPVALEEPKARKRSTKRAKILDNTRFLHYYNEEETLGNAGLSRLRLYETPVSAGVGESLEEQEVKYIDVPACDTVNRADYALRVNGDSMEPKFQNGDVVLIRSTETIESGQIGVFVLDGCGYIKVYHNDRLLSLNPAYPPISLAAYSDVQFKGRVIGRLAQK